MARTFRIAQCREEMDVSETYRTLRKFDPLQ